MGFVRIEVRVERAYPADWRPGRHPDDTFRTWHGRPAPVLEINVPWGPDEPGSWNVRHWRLFFRWPAPSWPCWQAVVGPVYVRVWRRGTTLYWNGYEPALMAVATTIEG